MCESCKAFAHLDPEPAPTYCVCDVGYATNTHTGSCGLCHGICDLCEKPNDDFKCYACITNAHFDPSDPSPLSGHCICDDGFYYDSGTKTCAACWATCRTCVDATITGCNGCWPNASFTGVSSACTCDPSFYANTDAATCA